ncbi:MAG: DegQ family serine endoprotease [Chitinispirillaceae bacterium]
MAYGKTREAVKIATRGGKEAAMYSTKRRTFTMITLIVSLGLCNCNLSAQTESKKEKIQFGAKENPATGTADKLGSFKTVFADVAEKVVPGVVSVIPTKIDTVVFHNNPFYRFFGNPFGQPRGEEPQVRKKERRQKGIGSGVIVSSKGHILTNYHVVSGADEIEVKLNDGGMYKAEIIGSDSLSDVSVLKIKEDVKDLPVAYLGDSDDLRTGDWVIAIGNPFSLTSTVTTGIVSAMGRHVSAGDSYQNFIQTDAAINPGNSGGALVNIEGELIGINTMIYSRTGGNMGIGFAIPINMARKITEDLINHGEVQRGWMGVSIQDMDAELQEAMDLKNRKGVLIGDVYEGQPAQKAGIRRGDIILSIDGEEIGSANELRNMVATIDPGNKVPVRIFRDGKEISVEMKVAKRDEEKIRNLAQSEQPDISEESKEKLQEKLGIKIANLSEQMRSEYSIERKVKGVVVTAVNRRFHGARRGLQEGDIITEVKLSGSGIRSVSDVKEFEKATAKLKKGDSVLFSVYRKGRTFFAAFKIGD